MTPNPTNSRPRAASPAADSAARSNSPAAAPGAGAERHGPVKSFRLGRISAAIWENGDAEKKFYSVKFTRTYLDDAKNFKHTDSFNRDDLPLVEKLADRAHTFIFERLAGSKAHQAEPAAG